MGDRYWTFAFTPDGEQIVAVDADGSLYLWDSNGQYQNEWKAHTKTTRAVDFFSQWGTHCHGK